MPRPILALILALVTAPAGCTRGRGPAGDGTATPTRSAQDQAADPAGERADIAPQAPVPPSPADEDGLITDKNLLDRVARYIRDQGVTVHEQEPRLYATRLSRVPQGSSRILAATADLKLFLFATDPAGSTLRPLDRLDGTIINVVKFAISSDDSHIWLWSQAPFRATEVRSVVEWDGARMKLASRKTADPTAEHYERQAALLAKGDIDGLLKEPDGGYLYPDFYPLHKTLPKGIVQLAYDRSLAAYKAGNLPDALRYLQYGLQQYGVLAGTVLVQE